MKKTLSCSSDRTRTAARDVLWNQWASIDVVAHKDGNKYYIQCKKFMTREVTPHDVRDFLGAITNVNNPLTKDFS